MSSRGVRRRGRWMGPRTLALAVAVAALAQACTPSRPPDAGEAGSPGPVGPPRHLVTVAAGDWSDASVWSGGGVPSAADSVEIRHAVRLDGDAAVGAILLHRSGSLSFDPSASRTLTVTANVEVRGTLEMRPSAAAIHTLRFAGIDEAAFVGEAEGPIDSDVGLWVMGRGRLDAVGTPRSGWLRTSDGLDAGATALTLESPPVGWEVGDEIVVVPTRAEDTTGFEVRRISAVSGTQVTLNAPLEHPHPAVDGLTPEVANLTRNVRIEGTPGGRTHVFIRSSGPQTIKHVAIRYVGPRNAAGFVLARYGLHFHRMFDDSRGSLVEGVVIRDSGSHSFVPHASHGITIRDSVAYDVMKEAFWWDRPPDPRLNDTRDSLWDHCLAAKVGGYGSEDVRASGFMLGSSGTAGGKPEPETGSGSRDEGSGKKTTGTKDQSEPKTGTPTKPEREARTGLPPVNVIRDSVAVGVDGDGKVMSGFQWPTGQSEPWEFSTGNVAHNNKLGIFVWSNDAFFHDIVDVRLYHNRIGLMHGAYQNLYRYEGLRLVNNENAAVELLATSGTGPRGRHARMDDVYIADAPVGLVIRKHALPPRIPTVLSGWSLEAVGTPIRVEEAGSQHPGSLDLVDWLVDGRRPRCSDVEVIEIHPRTVIRVFGGGGLLFRVTAAGCSG